MRKCKECGTEKDLDKFKPLKKGRFYTHQCKECRNKKLRTGKPNIGRFKKGCLPICPFPKGHVPANKGKYTSNERWSTRNKIWRKSVLERDGNKCVKCGLSEKLAIHHIKPWKEYPELRFDLDNGITVCVYCHGKEEGPRNESNGINTRFKKGHKLSQESIEKMKLTKRIKFEQKKASYGCKQ